MAELEKPSRAELFAALKNERLVRLFERLLTTAATTGDTAVVQAALDAHIADAADAHAASAIGVTPTGGITAIEAQSALEDLDAALSAHTTSTANPHSVTKAQVGLGNADNTSDANKPVSTAAQAELQSYARRFLLMGA